MSANTPKRQHFVPQVYLKNFRNTEGFLHVYDKETKRFLNKLQPSKVAFQTNLYTLRTPDGGKDFSVEFSFHDLENKFEAIMRKIKLLDAAALSQQDLADLLMFLALLNARNPRKIALLNWVGLKLCDCPSSPDFQKLTDPDLLKTSTMGAMHLWADKINDMMRKTEWVVYVSAPGDKFITTDNPMADLSCVPLSSNLLFAFQNARSNGMKEVSSDFVSARNHHIASTATRFLYAADIETLKASGSFCRDVFLPPDPLLSMPSPIHPC